VKQTKIVHLIDDTTAGGVMRVLAHIKSAPALSRNATHELRCVSRDSRWIGQIKADIIVSHLAISWRALPMLTALRLSHPTTALVHVEHSYTCGFGKHNVNHPRRFSALLRVSYQLFNKLVVVSHAQGAWLVHTRAVPKRKLVVIQSCVDLSAFRKISPPRNRVRVIGVIGRLDCQKGFDTFIRAFRQTINPGLSLHIYGEGPEEPALRELAGTDERIKFMGWAKNPVHAIASVDAVVMPSLWESYGLVAIEALAAGRQLVVSGIDGLSDHVAYGAHIAETPTVEGWQMEIQTLTRLDLATLPKPASSCDHLESVFNARWQSLIAELAPQ
jgi:D-inositol-3-phosphate glycosyltransferase